jgi:glycosyltransferase involved in cell wall biosynthesis
VTELAENLTVHPSNSSSRLGFPSDARRIAADLCREYPIDVVSTRDPFLFGRAGLQIKRQQRIPLNVHIMADMIDNPWFLMERFSNRIFNRYSRTVLRNADTIRVSTTIEKEKMVGLGYPPEKIFHVPFFVDLVRILESNDGGKRKELLQGKYDRVVLAVARLEKQKDIPVLVKSAAKVVQTDSRVLFLIIGSGGREKHIRRMISELGLQNNVRLLGHVDYSLLLEYYQAADVCAMTSRYEGTCMVLLEAAASGLPIISTATTGARDAVIEEQTGYLVEIGDSDAFARRLLDLLDDPAKAKKMGARGREYVVEKFDKERIIRDCITMWEYTASLKSSRTS